jgi:hypothetical protein
LAGIQKSVFPQSGIESATTSIAQSCLDARFFEIVIVRQSLGPKESPATFEDLIAVNRLFGILG